MVSVARVNALNMALVAASLAAAFALPFELFLFSYAVLGPLHYLTQISWMHRRHYFMRSGSAAGAGLLTLLALVVAGTGFVSPELNRVNPYLAFWAFGGALVMVLARERRTRLLALAGLALAAPLVGRWGSFHLLFSGFLPSIIHVCVFTAAFVLVGALKGRDRSGLALLAVFAAAVAACFLVSPGTPEYTVGEAAFTRYDSRFFMLNVSLSQVLLAQPFTRLEDVFTSAGGIAIARFIAFCYTYHYLNWFSKTSVIRWHDVPRAWLAGCAVLWLASLALYAWDYHLGVAALSFLSLIHVYLEFPLDHQAFLTIGRELKAIVRGRAAQRA